MLQITKGTQQNPQKELKEPAPNRIYSSSQKNKRNPINFRHAHPWGEIERAGSVSVVQILSHGSTSLDLLAAWLVAPTIHAHPWASSKTQRHKGNPQPSTTKDGQLREREREREVGQKTKKKIRKRCFQFGSSYSKI